MAKTLSDFTFLRAAKGLCGNKRSRVFRWRGFGCATFLYWEDKRMNLYENLYYKLFAAMADAVESLERFEPSAARKALIAAMRDAEEAVVSAEG